MTVAVATLGCTRKRDAIHSWDTLMRLQGDYRLYINWESQNAASYDDERKYLQGVEARLKGETPLLTLSVDLWSWRTVAGTDWRSRPKFDQDQARLASIVAARNMCIEFTMQTDCSHLLFIDADIIPPLDIIPKLLEVNHDAVGGYVKGRGTHSECEYVFGEKRRYLVNGYELIEAEHGNIGYTMLSRKLIENIRFRYGVSRYPDGREHAISDDPAFHLDAFIKFGNWMVIRKDVVGRHIGDLKAEEVAQF